MRDHQDAAPELVARLRTICHALPDVDEERAWVGTRWVVRTRTFAHVVPIADGWPPAYARSAGTDGPATLLTFRSEGDELEALRGAGHPFFVAHWGRDVVAMILDAPIGWDEVAELLTESYCVMAPKKLSDLVERPLR